MHSIKLTYFNDGKGRNELTRLIFAVGSVSYKDELIDYAKYKSLCAEDKLPFGQLPTLTINGDIYGQSCSLARCAAKIAGLYPSDIVEALKADSIVDSWRDCLDLFYETVFARVIVDGKLTMIPQPRPLRQGKLNAFVNTELEIHFAKYDRMILPDDQFCRGSFPCFADLAVYDLVKTMQGALEEETFNELVDDKGKLMALVRRVDDLEPIKKHLEKYPYKDIQHLFKVEPSARSS